MSDNVIIPEDIQQFLIQNIFSVAQLEGLLLLRSDAQQKWTVEIIAQRLYIDKNEAVQLMEQLCATGFLVASKGKTILYKYRPTSPELHQMVERTALIYSQYLLPVTHIIHSRRKNRIQEFADAFLIRKE